MRKHSTFSTTCIILVLSSILLSGCLSDVPNVKTRLKGKSIVIYGKVVNSDTRAPVPNAVISDGFSTTLTNTNGEYSFKSYPEASHVFISVPASYEIPMEEGMPRIFKTIDTSKDSLQVIFDLKPLTTGVEKTFTLIAIADPQTPTTRYLKRFENEALVDIQKTSKEYQHVYGITLGDLASDNPEFLVYIKGSLTSLDIPFFNTIGNHDFSSNFRAPDEASKDFVANFGPLNYSFNRGDAHIIVLNNVFNYGVTTYHWGFSEEQISWIKSDLKHVTKEKMLIVCVHVPVLPSKTMERKHQFLEAISSFNEVHILSGHWHANRNIINTDLDIYEHITGAASGMWWGSVVNKCGAPNGYGVYEISGNKMKNWYYKSVNYDKEHQIRVLEPYTFGDKAGYIIANVWNADDRWKIELFEDGVNKGQMERFTNYAPEVYALNKTKNVSENTSAYQETNHLFRRKPTNPNAKFSIKATDSFGNVYQQDVTTQNIETLIKY